MAELLAASSHVPIAQLSPEPSSISNKYIKAIVTLIWPYSSSTSTLKVLLAEPDFRLRRAKGQVRVQFSGSSARSVFEAGIGSGDEVILSLDGVEWSKDESAGHTPGRSVDWELKFSERLLLQIFQVGGGKASLIDIDHPILTTQSEVVQDIPELEPLPSPPKLTASKHNRPELIRSETNEWSSPAFVKRARVSYGSLFESGYDMFADEDETAQGKGRKRAKFGRRSGAWRYSSRSQSPEPIQVDEDENSGMLVSDKEAKPLMTDEGCQTLGLEDNNAAEALADLSRQQEIPMNSVIIVENHLGAQERNTYGMNEILSKSGASIDMQSSPLSPIALPEQDQEKNTEQQATSHNIEKMQDSEQADPVPSGIISDAPLFQPADPVINTVVPTNTTTEVEDLYGLSPTANGYPRNAGSEPSIGQTGSDHRPLQFAPENDNYEELHHSQDDEASIAYLKLPSRSISPDSNLAPTVQVYPEPDTALNPEIIGYNGPYFGTAAQSHPDVIDEQTAKPSDGSRDMNTEAARSPNPNSMVANEASRDTPTQKLLARHLSTGGTPMSRSHSGHSETIDLTEDSSDEGEGALEGSETDDERVNGQFYRSGQVEDQFIEEKEGYESLLYDREDSESVENGFDYDDEDSVKYPSGFNQAEHLAPGEVADDGEYDEEEYDENEMEEEGSYDEEDASEDEDASTSIKRPYNGEPEVIDLLSSDEENREDNDASENYSAHEDDVAANLDETNSMLVEEKGSEAEPDSNEESSEEEKMDDWFAGDNLDDSEPTRLDEPAELPLMGELIDESNSQEDDIEAVKETKPHRETILSPSHSVNKSGSLPEVHSDTKKLASASPGGPSSYVWNDGASESMDHDLVPPQGGLGLGTVANVNGNREPVTEDITYPKLRTLEEEESQYQERAQHEDKLEMPQNGQLPTPDATQLSAVIAPDMSFSSINSLQPPSPTTDVTNGVMGDVEESSREAVGLVEEASTKDSVHEITAEALEDAAEEIHADAITESAKETIENLGMDEAKPIDENSTMDVITETSLEVIREETPSGSLTIATETVRDVVTEAIKAAPVTPRRSKRLSFSHQQQERIERSPSLNMDEPRTPDPDAYDASVELAMAALDSPSKEDPDGQQFSDKQLRVMLSRPLRTNLGVFTTLKLVRFNLEKKLDVLAIVTSLPPEPQRIKHGLRHYHLRYNITDATAGPNGVISVNIFRPYRTALPTVQPGEVVLLRNFLAKAEKGATFTLRSDEASSWVVFKHGGAEEVRGPPVEYGDEERDHVTYLKAWYQGVIAIEREG